jgi:citrate synthase
MRKNSHEDKDSKPQKKIVLRDRSPIFQMNNRKKSDLMMGNTQVLQKTRTVEEIKFEEESKKFQETNKCTIKFNNKEIELPLLKGTDGQQFIDVRSLYAKSGLFTFDPGFTCTASCASKITYIDGKNGVLQFRGYLIKDLAENCTYLEVCFLLIFGTLPSKSELENFENEVYGEMHVHTNMASFFKSFRHDSHPMAIMTSIIASLSAFDHNKNFIADEEYRKYTALRLIAKIPLLAAFAFRTSMGLPLVYPKKKFSYMENFLRMMFKDVNEKWEPTPIITRAMEKIFILHADHEQNASTSTVRISASSLANPFACIAAGIASLWGPAHGGANEAAINMLEVIGDVSQIDKYIEKAKDKADPFRLMGFGHRVYKNYDPRATFMKSLADDVLKVIDTSDQRLKKIMDVAKALEKRALEDEYFIKRKLYPNVDFYTGIIYSAIGIPKEMFTVMFACSRSVGWITQVYLIY